MGGPSLPEQKPADQKIAVADDPAQEGYRVGLGGSVLNARQYLARTVARLWRGDEQPVFRSLKVPVDSEKRGSMQQPYSEALRSRSSDNFCEREEMALLRVQSIPFTGMMNTKTCRRPACAGAGVYCCSKPVAPSPIFTKFLGDPAYRRIALRHPYRRLS